MASGDVIHTIEEYEMQKNAGAIKKKSSELDSANEEGKFFFLHKKKFLVSFCLPFPGQLTFVLSSLF